MSRIGKKAVDLPSGVTASMSGQTIEIINTDAEGRLILADALALADADAPELILDRATGVRADNVRADRKSVV